MGAGSAHGDHHGVLALGLTKLPFGNPTTIPLLREEYRVPILPPELAAYMATTIELAVPWLRHAAVISAPRRAHQMP